jgi:hypothetical protein
MAAKELPHNNMAARMAIVGNMDKVDMDLTTHFSPSQWSGILTSQIRKWEAKSLWTRK